jgi:MOSC domain-containing protein YiiM
MSVVDAERLERGLAEVRGSPPREGRVELIVRRPAEGEREVVEECALDLVEGVVGDRWSAGSACAAGDRTAQVTVMNARAIGLVAGGRERWPLAGDQLYVDLDLSVDNLPPGTRLAIGSAVIEVSAEPHTGCAKFSRRYGSPALRLVNSPAGRALRLRGLNASVVEPGRVRVGDPARKLPAAPVGMPGC